MDKTLYFLLAFVLMISTIGCSGSNEIKEPSREGFNAGAISPSTADVPKQSEESFELD